MGKIPGWAVLLAIVACGGSEGPQGPAGPKGATGPQGAPGGPAGTSSSDAYEPRFWVSCSKVLDVIALNSSGGLERMADGSAETFLAYTVLIYSNSDVDAECSAAIGTSQSGSDNVYYPSVVHGAAIGGCDASADYPPAGTDGGFFAFEASAGPNATYNDQDNPLGLNGFTYTYAEADCDAYTFDGSTGDWTQTTLAAVFKK
jgi:hypothetical protein